MMGTARGLVRDFLYRYVVRYKRMVFLSLSLMLVVAVSRMAPAYILKVAIDRFISRGDFYGLSLAALLYQLSSASNMPPFTFRYMYPSSSARASFAT